MVKVDLVYDNNIPQYSCSECGRCNSVFAKSFCKIKNRGCCFYFPKFTLYEIHKMVKKEAGRKLLKKIVNMPDTVIYNYYIHAKGYFDQEGLKEYLKSNKIKENVHDKTIFFRACPFVEPNVGCTIPAEFRSYVCNFFICDEVLDKLGNTSRLRDYLRERENYVHWIDWENNSIQMMLEDKMLNLKDNFKEVIDILSEMPLEQYEFMGLEPLEV